MLAAHSRFHVDKLSSAHVYVRLHAGETFETMPAELVAECAQLTKANSIEGCKLNDVPVVYTPWDNLMKDATMAVGQVGFHDSSRVRRTIVARKDNALLRAFKRCQEERTPDLKAERVARDQAEIAAAKAERRAAHKEQAMAEMERRLAAERAEAERRELEAQAVWVSNKTQRTVAEAEDDFM